MKVECGNNKLEYFTTLKCIMQQTTKIQVICLYEHFGGFCTLHFVIMRLLKEAMILMILKGNLMQVVSLHYASDGASCGIVWRNG